MCIRDRAWKLSAVGIPIGLIFGYLAGFCMSPSLTADAQISAQAGKTAQTVVSANPLIFFAAALLTLLTVYLSSLQAVSYTHLDVYKRQTSKTSSGNRERTVRR